MTHLIRNAFLAVLTVGVAGCEWSGGGEDNSWNDSGSIANFNGNYHADSGYLVSEYTTSSSSSGGGGSSGYTDVNGESGGTALAGDYTTFSGTVAHRPVKAGTLTITLGNLGSFTDDGSGAISGTYRIDVNGPATRTGTGTINYDTGTWTLTLASPGLPENRAITLSYVYGGTSSDGGTVTTPSEPGSSGISIYAFNVQQTGNKLKIIDNNGSIYEGSLGDMRTTGNSGSGASGTFVNGDQLIATFSASGKSKSGMYVNMTGNFQGTLEGVTTVTSTTAGTKTTKTSMALSNRRIMGTWIEDGGKTGNISGVSDSAVNVVSTIASSTNSATLL